MKGNSFTLIGRRFVEFHNEVFMNLTLCVQKNELYGVLWDENAMKLKFNPLQYSKWKQTFLFYNFLLSFKTPSNLFVFKPVAGIF